jgi:hypothetical protein
MNVHVFKILKICTFQSSASSCVVISAELTGKFIMRNLSLVSAGDWKSGCSTTLMVTDAVGTNVPVLGRTLNFSGDVVLIWNC